MKNEKAAGSGQENKLKNWLRRLGWAGFLFFLIKGLVWLAIFFGLGTWLSSFF